MRRRMAPSLPGWSPEAAMAIQSVATIDPGSPFSAADLAELNRRFTRRSPEQILTWAGKAFSPDLSLACSFGGPSGMVLVDMVARLGLDVEIFYLDTDVLFPETYKLVEQVTRRYGVQPVAYRSRLTLDEQAQQHGERLWARDPDRCCYLRKVEPNVRALAGKKAWISGIRRDQ